MSGTGGQPPCEYSQALARRYDRDYAALGRTQDVGFYVGLAREAAGPVLEVGCGTGRVLLPMARAGATVTGVDPSPLMRRQLLQKLGDQPEEVRGRVRVHAGHLQAVPVPGPFALVCSPFRAFQHLVGHGAQLAALTELRRVLAPGGLLAFDVFDFDPAQADRAAEGHVDCRYEEDGALIERRVQGRYDERGRRLELVIRWERDGRPTGEESACNLTVISRDELLRLLDEAGLEAQAVHGDFDGSAWDPERPRELVVLARPRR
jgi:SAM-dependent methyltransferase